MRSILFFLFISVCQFFFAQPDNSTIIEIDGVKYYQHIVEKGNTIWGLQQVYHVTSEELLIANPTIVEGLKVGDVIYVLSKETTATPVLTINYLVKKNETLYGLSKKFDLSINDLVALNPEIKDGLKRGQMIKVPKVKGLENEALENSKKDQDITENPFVVASDSNTQQVESEQVTISFSDSTILHTVLKKETMYSISKRFMIPVSKIMELNNLTSTTLKTGQILTVIVKNERIAKVKVKEVPAREESGDYQSISFEDQDVYNVAILLPFHLDYGASYSENVSDLATQFYMGALIALDSLKELGVKLKVQVYDTKNDSITIAGIFAKPGFLETNLVIGPLLKEEVKQVAKLCKSNQILMVCVVGMDSGILEDNPLVYSTVTSHATLVRGMARFLAEENESSPLVLVKPSDKEGVMLFDVFRNEYEKVATATSASLIESSIEGFNTHMRRRADLRFILPTNNEKSARKFMNNVNRSSFRASPDKITVYGMKSWVKFTNINNIYKNKYHFHFPAANHLDYYTPFMVAMNRNYRTKYGTDMSRVAVQGYDVLMYFCNSFFLKSQESRLLMNDFKLVQISPADGFENSNIFIVKQEDFQLMRIMF